MPTSKFSAKDVNADGALLDTSLRGAANSSHSRGGNISKIFFIRNKCMNSGSLNNDFLTVNLMPKLYFQSAALIKLTEHSEIVRPLVFVVASLYRQVGKWDVESFISILPKRLTVKKYKIQSSPQEGRTTVITGK